MEDAQFIIDNLWPFLQAYTGYAFAGLGFRPEDANQNLVDLVKELQKITLAYDPDADWPQ
jgi:hypothetical protein